MVADDQKELAATLAGVMNEGSTAGCGVTALDVLDDLASVGLKLVADGEGVASASYLEEIATV